MALSHAHSLSCVQLTVINLVRECQHFRSGKRLDAVRCENDICVVPRLLLTARNAEFGPSKVDVAQPGAEVYLNHIRGEAGLVQGSGQVGTVADLRSGMRVSLSWQK